MKWFANLPTPAKLLLAFGSMLLIVILLIFTSYRSLSNMSNSILSLRDNNFDVMLELEKFNSMQNYNRSQVLEMVLAADEKSMESFEASIDEKTRKSMAIIASISSIALNVESLTLMKELREILDVHIKTRSGLIAMMHDGRFADARLLAIGAQDESYDRIRSIATALVADSRVTLNRIMEKDQQNAENSMQISLVMGIIALLVGIVMIILLHFTMARPLVAISRIAVRIAAGDLTARVEAGLRTDEMGVMTNALSKMMETLSSQIHEIMDGVNVLATSSHEILVSTSLLASGAVESATGISETMTTVEELRQAARLSSEKAKVVADSAQIVARVSQTGKAAVDETDTTMLLIRDQMGAIAQTILRLSDNSQAIGGIIALVTDLADQSNLLAVNAAIEAAKAGEQGRGFVVVAQEIRNLAEQSKQATSQIRGILTEIQKTTGVAVLVAEQGTRAVENGVKQSSQTGEAVKILTESSLESSQMAIQIVASSQQQVVGMDQIGVAMMSFNQAGALNSSAMKQAETAAKKLNDLGQKLRKLVDQFNIKEV